MRSSIPIMLLIGSSLVADQQLVLDPHHDHGSIPAEVVLTVGVVYSQGYTFETVYNACSISGGMNRWVCDDFILDDFYSVTEIRVWIIWTGEQASVLNLVISEDDAGDSDPNTNTDVWVESVPCTNTFTGDSNWGYDIYETHCTLSEDIFPELEAGVRYYFEIQADIWDNCFVVCPVHLIGDYLWYDDGSGVWTSSYYQFGIPEDMFFNFYGEPVSALESETWGSIKTLF